MDSSYSSSSESRSPHKLQSKLRRKRRKISDLKAKIKRLQKQLDRREDYIEDLISQVRQLSRKLDHAGHTVDAAVQTETTPTHIAAPAQPASNEWNLESGKSIAEQVTEVASATVFSLAGMVYEEKSGLYYDYNTGFYYDAERGLYYDGNYGTYYRYDEESKSMIREDLPGMETSKRKRKKKCRFQKSRRRRNGACSPSSTKSEGEIDSTASSTDDENGAWPPCIRIIVQETKIPTLKVGSLFLVTCTGGEIGSKVDNAVYLDDAGLLESHARIAFDEEAGQYTVANVAQDNKVQLNGKRLKKFLDIHEVVHGSILQVGSTKLLCHIHRGTETCGHCEPGLLQTSEQNSDTALYPNDKEKDRKKFLKQIRKKYGLENADPNLVENPDYKDRAGERRKVVGSEDPFLASRTEEITVEDPIKSDNKGFKMLSKMGWKVGDTLGQSQKGLEEPLPLVGQTDRTGLGSVHVPPPTKKSKIWMKTQERFNNLEETTSETAE